MDQDALEDDILMTVFGMAGVVVALNYAAQPPRRSAARRPIFEFTLDLWNDEEAFKYTRFACSYAAEQR